MLIVIGLKDRTCESLLRIPKEIVMALLHNYRALDSKNSDCSGRSSFEVPTDFSTTTVSIPIVLEECDSTLESSINSKQETEFGQYLNHSFLTIEAIIFRLFWCFFTLNLPVLNGSKNRSLNLI